MWKPEQQQAYHHLLWHKMSLCGRLQPFASGGLQIYFVAAFSASKDASETLAVPPNT